MLYVALLISGSGKALLAGRGVVVSGGSRGIGRAVAELLGSLGAGVVVNGRDTHTVAETVAAITASGGRAIAVVGPADDERIARTLVDECVTAFGRLDTLINCAGIAEPSGSSILNISPEEFDHLIGAHLGTAFHTCRAAATVMAAQGQAPSSTPAQSPFWATTAGPAIPQARAPSTP